MWFEWRDRLDDIWNANRRTGDVAMIIRISAPSQTIEIDDARNFRAFSVRIEGLFDDPAVGARQAATANMPGFPKRCCANGRSSLPYRGWTWPSWRNSLFGLPAFPHI